MIKRFRLAVCLLVVPLPGISAEKAPGFQANPRKLNPPPGIVVPPEVKAELSEGVTVLTKEIDSLRSSLTEKSGDLQPDVQIFQNAVSYALEDDIFYNTNQFKIARALLKAGMDRARQLRNAQAPWSTATGLVVRGYVSRLDGSVQPYGLVVPANYESMHKPVRLDVWLHGRGDTMSELAFIDGRQKSAGEFTPQDTIVLHPYGRFMNAFKFAGEVDVFEALEHVKKHYAVDENHIVMRGFSMGGAGAWHLGAHHADKWAAVNPGAGFVDVKNYQNLAGKLGSIPWYEQKLWNLYDALACPINFANTSLVAYSGEIDEQKKAADLMEAALSSEGFKMTHIIGPQTGHKYEPEAKKEVARLVDAAAAKGRDPTPRKVQFVTYSLKWNTMHWVQIDALEKHWDKAEVIAEIVPGGEASRIEVKTRNVAAISFDIAPAAHLGKGGRLLMDGQDLGFQPTGLTPSGKPGSSEGWWRVSAQRASGRWQIQAGSHPASGRLLKRHNLQGPIDDALMGPFIFVRPTATAMNETLGRWVQREMEEAALQWRRQFRGQPRVKDDSEISQADIDSNNLVLWGDPSSDRLLGKIKDELPLTWTSQHVTVAGKKYEASSAVPVLIYPNPLNPERYLVLNSGFTFSQFGGGSNSQQTPKLPDWAILDLGVPVRERIAGKGVLDAGFFGEKWELLTAQ